MELTWEEVVENNAWTTSKGWRPCPITSSDPARFTTNDYTKFRHPKDIPLPQSDSYHQWVWCGDWTYSNWKYCKKWDRNIMKWSHKQNKSARCRRRYWKRPRIRNNDETAQTSIREVVYENQRYLVKRWASPYLPKDRPHWSDVNGTPKTQGTVNNKLPLNWKWIDNEWQNDIIENETDSEGWQYAKDFNVVNWAPKRTILHHVRRRKWIRTRMRSNKDKTLKTRLIRTVSDTSMLKHIKSEQKIGDFDGTLVVSYTNQFELTWSTHGVIESSGYQCSIWTPKLGRNEYFLGNLLSGEKTYPTKTFLVIIKKNGSDSDAFRKPTGLTLIWSTRFSDPTAAMHGHFYKPVAPPGYVALGDVVISKKKGTAVTVADFPKLVCIKKEFVDSYTELFNTDKYSKQTKSLIQPHTMIWNTKRVSNTNVHCQLWTQPPFSNEVESPFFVCNKLSKPSNVYPRLNIRYVLQDDPDNIVINTSFMTKKGKALGSQQRKRFFILTSDRQLQYFATDECRDLKGTVDLTKMTSIACVQQNNTDKLYIPTEGRKWVFTCDTSQDSIRWVNEINRVWQNPKAVVNKIIAAQIQGQPLEDNDYQFDEKTESKALAKQLFDAPLHEQVVRLLAKNINIIRKILKGDLENIQNSVVDDIVVEKEPQIKKKRSRASFKRSLSTDTVLSTSEELMNSHNENKLSVFKYFDDAWQAVRLLLKHFDIEEEEKDNESVKKHGGTVQQFISQIPQLRQQSIEYLLNNITNYVKQYGDSPDPFEIIKMCDACAVVESFRGGRQRVVAEITNTLLKGIKQKYAPGTEYAGCQFVEQRFEEYNKQVSHYDGIYSFFIPAKWIVPVTFSLRFCKLTGDQIDEHLKKSPEKTQMVMRAKQTCIENEKRLQKEARAFLSQPQSELDKDEIEHTLPEYVGMISTILDQHLNSYISAERRKAEECVMSAKNETFSVLSEDGSLTEMYESGVTKNSSQKHNSCETLLVAIRVGFKKCIHISRGQQLIDLLLAHQQYLSEYCDILRDLTRECLETNGVIVISPSNKCSRKCSRQKPQMQQKLTERYLWFDGYETDEKCADINQKRDRNADATVIQQVLTFLVLVYNSSLYCKDSMLNLGKASHKAIESNELKTKVDFRPLHQQFESLQFDISERLSQSIVCRIVRDIDQTYQSMDFKNMSEKDYITLEKCRHLVEIAWSNLAIQLLYIMPIAHYKLMIKRCVYLLAEYIFESTLRLRDINRKIAKLLMANYTHIKEALLRHLSNESQHLASEIEAAVVILFAPTDVLYDLLCTENELMRALEESNERSKSNDSLQNGFTFESLKTKFNSYASENASVDMDTEPIYYKKYTEFEMKIVDFYHTSNVVFCFQTLLLQLVENQIKVNRSAKISVKPRFFDAFKFEQYHKPQHSAKLVLKATLIHKIMDCKSINQERQLKIESLYKEKSNVDMSQEQQKSVHLAIEKKEVWEKEEKEKRLLAQKEASAMTFFNNKTPTNDNTSDMPDTQPINEQIMSSGSDLEDDDVIVMTQTIDVKDVENTIVTASEPTKTEPTNKPQFSIVDSEETVLSLEHKRVDTIEVLEEKLKGMMREASPFPKSKLAPPIIPPPPKPIVRGASPSPKVPHLPPPKVPYARPPPIPRGVSPSPSPKPSVPMQRAPALPSNSRRSVSPKPPMQRPPPKPMTKPVGLKSMNNKEDGGYFSNFSKNVSKLFVGDED